MPEMIGRYEIQEEIGRGGMGIVYRAYDARFDRHVALKILPPEFVGSEGSRSRFAREARLVAALEHPAIVPVYDYGEEEGRPYFVMRLMLGGSLADRIQEYPLRPREAVDLVEQLAAALDQAHAKKIIHRDLKPGNILFDQQNKPYLSDFGIATMLQPGSENVSLAFGTPTYMSPEQLQGNRPLDGRSDLYSLAVVIWESLTGTTPYEAENAVQMAIQHLRESLPSIRTLRPELPPAFEDVMARALATAPGARYASAAALAAAMRDALATYRPPPSSFLHNSLVGRGGVQGAPGERPNPPAATRGARRVATPARTPRPQTPRPTTPRPQTPRPQTPRPQTPRAATPPAVKLHPAVPRPAVPVSGSAAPAAASPLPTPPARPAPRPAATPRRSAPRPPLARLLREYLFVLLFGGAALLVALLFLLAQ